MRSLVVLASLCLGGSAVAAPKLAPASQANPPRFVDESSVFMQVGNLDDGYWVDVHADVFGVADKDRVRLDVKRGGKLLVSAECKYASTRTEGLWRYTCRAGDKKVIKVAGPLEADLILEEDATDKEYVIRTFKANVKAWEKTNFQIEADDLLATAYLVPQRMQSGEKPELRFWIAGRAAFNAVLRCSVNGKTLRDITGTLDAAEGLSADIIKGAKRTTWQWTRTAFTPVGWWVSSGGKPHKDLVYLNENPGQWECQLRRNGITLREFRFKVSPGGDVEQHPMQQAKDAPLMVPRFAMIDMRIPKDTGLDQRIKPALLKKSRGFGLPWPQHESVKAVLAALPPAFENATPPVPKRKPGKLINGADAKPPRFVDESRAHIRLGRDMNGYNFYTSQVVGGVSFAEANFFRLDWKQGGKLIASAKCSTQERLGEAFVDCDYRDKALTAKGAIEASLIQYDDSDGNEYLLRTYKFNVANPKSFGDAVWQVVPDDLLATAWVKQSEHGVKFRFWLAMENASPSLRCTVNGKQVPDIELSTGHVTIEFDVIKKGSGDKTEYVWQYMDGAARSDGSEVLAGVPKDAKATSDRVDYLGRYPGKWDCMMRHKGKQIRQLLFTVNDKGWIEADPAQAGGPPTSPNVVPIALRFGKDVLDVRVRPAAMKKSRGFGLAWPKPPTQPFPAASGLPDPK